MNWEEEQLTMAEINSVHQEVTVIEDQFGPNWMERFDNKVIELGYATSKSDRIQSRDKGLKIRTTRTEVRKLLDTAFLAAIESQETDGIRVLQRNEKFEKGYLSYLKEQREFYNEKIQANTDLHQIEDPTRPDQLEYKQEMLSRLPLYLSMAIGNTLLILNYHDRRCLLYTSPSPRD